VIDTIKKVDKVLEEPEPVVQFLKMADFSLNFVARGWVEDYLDAWGTWLEMTEKIYDALNEAHIKIPFPTRTVYTKKMD
jgi:MscS family membrane protein